MNSNFRKMLFAAAGLVVLSLPASAAGSTAVTDSPVLKANSTKPDAAGPAPVRPERRQRRLQEVEEEEGEEVRQHSDFIRSASRRFGPS